MKREEDIEEQAALWADRQRRREMGQAAKAELRAWLDGEPERAALLRAHAELLNDPALGQASKAALGDLSSVRSRPRPQTWRLAATWSAGLAAAALTVGVLIWPAPQGVTREVFEAPSGRPLSASLDDGSAIRLNGGSDIRTTFDRRKREVHLRGEGFFAVAKDAKRPFSVITATHRVTALGTRFNVDERSEGAVEISLLEGRIEVADLKDPTRRIVMTAGQRLVAGKGPLSTALVRPLASDKDTPDWTKGWIDADDMNLADLLLELQRQAPGLKAGLGDPSLARRRVSGRFEASDPREVLTVVAAAQGLKLRTEPSGRVLIDR
jgi:transmembrane sensor